ncbi:T9SS type A sorting domain-containing protein [Psychroserpens sp. Hel_I_66]|uniref:T9SS type A sorting domain-containing protein n=1 Tax=Psychroserpens sp. Hel_I_66 TaxID=1250004 RepID=UPI000647B7BB|nr:T9SS type A sorting domain-containing protein [Psychroserpens sp. Hel_I_66]
MKTKLLFIILLLPTVILSQINQGFENVPGITFDGGACRYFDFDTATVHELQNYNSPCGIIYVKETGSASTLGYFVTLDPTTSNGPAGFSDGDNFGVATAASFVSGIGLAPPEGSQGFYMQDVDGTVLMSFDVVDLAGTTNPQFSMNYILETTGYELEDFVKISIKFTDCASSTIDLLNSVGSDINDLGIEGSWNTLSADLSTYSSCKAQLLVQFSSNSTAEELGIDGISFSQGTVLSNNKVDLVDALSVYPNPSNGVITIKNSGVELTSAIITDVNGRIVSSIDLKGTSLDSEINLSSVLSSGMYFIKIFSDNASTVKKLIIK